MSLSVHRYWTGDAIPDGEPFNGRVQRQLHDARRVFDWTDDTLPPEIADAVAARAAQVPPGAEQRRHRANIARWWLLRRYGGVWADHDVIPLVSLLGLPRPFIAAHADGTVCPSIFGLDPGDPWAEEAIAQIDAAEPAERSADASGGNLIDRCTPRRVQRIPLPFDNEGRRRPGSYLWAIHTFASTAGAPAMDPAPPTGGPPP